MEEEEELLECNAGQLACMPEPAGMSVAPAPTAEPAPEAPHLDDAARDLIDTGPTIGPSTGSSRPPRAPSYSSPTLREAARRDASEDAFDWRLGEHGPYAYGEHREGTGFHPGGTTFGFGLGHNLDTGEREGGGGDLLNAHFGAGEWRNQDGEECEGIRLNGGIFSMSEQGGQDAPVDELDIGAGTFDFGAYSTDETFTAGAQANLGEVALIAGGEEASAERDDDTDFRVGASAGGGLAFRAHYGDEDGDGDRERGIGADLGPLSFDLRSEYIGRAYDWAFGD